MAAQHEHQAVPGQHLKAVRKAHYGPNTSLLHDSAIIAGSGTYLVTEDGRKLLDCVNNVTILGHGNHEVADAVSQQLHTLNTNSRYLHPALVEYTCELLSTLPPALQVLYLACSGSEANELALRVAHEVQPEADHVVVMAGAYHGHTSTLIDLSPYKFWGKGGRGKKPHVHVMPCPDPYRGQFLDGRAAAKAVLSQARAAGGRVAAFITESILSCGGQVVLPPGYLQDVYEVMHEAGVVCIADEVQCGFGRVGTHFWGFQTQHVVPDIVVLGKPMGNGYPVSGVAMTRQLADAFSAGGMEYFNTCGGSTAAAVAALTVLRCVQRDGLQQHALEVGQYLSERLRELQQQYPEVLGDVRGVGLMLGVECVRDARTKHHAPAIAAWIRARCKARDVLLSIDGPYENVLKIKPPLVFGIKEADVLVDTLKCVLSEELTPEVHASLMEQELELWDRVFGPRMAVYAHSAAELGLSPKFTHAMIPSQKASRAAQTRYERSVPVMHFPDAGLQIMAQPANSRL